MKPESTASLPVSAFSVIRRSRACGALRELADSGLLRGRLEPARGAQWHADLLGEPLWDGVDRRTREILLVAEALWRSLEALVFDDYSAVGLHYRRAIENEWRARVGHRLARCLNRRVESLTPGEMLRAVRDCGPMARQLLARELVPDTRLFDLDFMRLVIDLCDTFLNDSAHPEGLDRRACVALRAILLDQGVLRDLLRSVQPAARPWEDGAPSSAVPKASRA